MKPMNLLREIPEETPKEMKYNVNQPGTVYDVATATRYLIRDAKSFNRDIIVVCIGTDRSTGDALGPLAGSKLRSINMFQHVYGTLDEPVHATNLVDKIDEIKAKSPHSFLIAVDACLGKLENVGCVSLGKGSIKPGAAVKKELPSVGDAYITGVVNVGGFMEHLVLQSTRLSLVMKMADTIAYGLSFALYAGQKNST